MLDLRACEAKGHRRIPFNPYDAHPVIAAASSACRHGVHRSPLPYPGLLRWPGKIGHSVWYSYRKYLIMTALLRL